MSGRERSEREELGNAVPLLPGQDAVFSACDVLSCWWPFCKHKRRRPRLRRRERHGSFMTLLNPGPNPATSQCLTPC